MNGDRLTFNTITCQPFDKLRANGLNRRFRRVKYPAAKAKAVFSAAFVFLSNELLRLLDDRLELALGIAVRHRFQRDRLGGCRQELARVSS
jgi:hypothetical protein